MISPTYENIEKKLPEKPTILIRLNILSYIDILFDPRPVNSHMSNKALINHTFYVTLTL